MNKHIFIINGSGGVGKDTFCNLVDEVSNGQVYSYSSVNLVKKVAEMCGWNGAKEEHDRKFLSDLKDLLTKYNDAPFKNTCEVIDKFLVGNSFSILFIHFIVTNTCLYDVYCYEDEILRYECATFLAKLYNGIDDSLFLYKNSRYDKYFARLDSCKEKLSLLGLCVLDKYYSDSWIQKVKECNRLPKQVYCYLQSGYHFIGADCSYEMIMRLKSQSKEKQDFREDESWRKEVEERLVFLHNYLISMNYDIDDQIVQLRDLLYV